MDVMEETIDVFYDYKDLGEKIALGVVLMEEDEMVYQEYKEIDKPKGTNYYHWTIEAMLYALETIEDTGDEAVKLLNQQKQVVDWLANQNYGENYQAHYTRLMQKLAELSQSIQMDYEIIEGTKNKAKKYLDKLKKDGKLKSRTGGSLNEIFGNIGKKDANQKPKTQKKSNGTYSKQPTKENVRKGTKIIEMYSKRA